jgi:hypothetical protein
VTSTSAPGWARRASVCWWGGKNCAAAPASCDGQHWARRVIEYRGEECKGVKRWNCGVRELESGVGERERRSCVGDVMRLWLVLPVFVYLVLPTPRGDRVCDDST